MNLPGYTKSTNVFLNQLGWSGGAMVLGELPVPGRPTIWMIVGQGPIVLAVGAGGGCLDIFTLLYLFSSLSPSLWETARYRLKYCLKGPLNPKQPTNQPILNQYVCHCYGINVFHFICLCPSSEVVRNNQNLSVALNSLYQRPEYIYAHMFHWNTSSRHL